MIYTGKRIILLLFLFTVFSGANGQTKVPQGRRFRDIVRDLYPNDSLFIGATSHAYLLSSSTGSVLAREFNYITPANKFKQSYIHPEPGIWRWDDSDMWVAYARKNNQIMRLHAPISPQSSPWVKDDNRTADELKLMLEEFMSALCLRYNDTSHIKWLDVVNETVSTDGSWFGPEEGTDSWENPWPKMGFDTDPYQTPLYIKQAFEIADSLAPNLKLIINQHGTMDDTIWNKIKATVFYLRNQGLRVDGIGWQAHVDAGWEKEDNNIERLQALIEWAHAHDLEFHVTENNSWIRKWEINTPEKEAKRYEDQAATFAAIVRTLLPYRKTGVVTWNLWHLEDDQAQGYTWDKYGCMWAVDGEPKPAYYAVQRVLEMRDDSLRYNTAIQVLDNENDSIISHYTVIFDDDTINSFDHVVLEIDSILPGMHEVKIFKQDYDTYQTTSFYVHRDSTYTIKLNPARYNVGFRVMDDYNLELIHGVNVTLNSNAKQSDSNGEVIFNVISGEYEFDATHPAYASVDTMFFVYSDTSFAITLTKTHGDVKFKMRCDGQPVNDVQVVLNEDTLHTNSLGMVTFSMLQVNSQYQYHLSREEYKPMKGMIDLVSDTTLNLQLKKSHATIHFDIPTDSYNVNKTFIIIEQDTATFTAQGRAGFYNMPVDSSYIFDLYTEDVMVLTDTLVLLEDTTITINYIPSNVKDSRMQESIYIYPNPARQYITVKSDLPAINIKIYSETGKLMRKLNYTDSLNPINISEFPEGMYWVRFLTNHGKSVSKPFMKMN